MRVGVWAFGSDRPGIVAAITGAIVAAGGNLMDTSMTILSGQFAMVLIVEGVPDIDAFAARVADAGTPLAITTSVRAIETSSTDEMNGARCIVSVHGADRPGIVHEFAAALAARDANITDLRTRVIGDVDAPVYTMLIETELPGGVGVEMIDAEMRALAERLGIDAHAHPVDDDVL